MVPDIPANVPAKQFWSVLVYVLNTCAFVEHTPKARLSSLDKGLEINKDGSVDIYFGKKAPKGKEANWAPTAANKDFFLLAAFTGRLRSSLTKVTN